MKTIRYAQKLNTTFPNLVFGHGTPVYKEYEKQIIANNFEEFTQYDLFLITKC